MSRLLAVALLLLAPSWAGAHAFPDHSEPRVGHTVEASPPAVRIWFDGQIEPVFSKLRVEDANNRQVDKGDSRVNPTDANNSRGRSAAAGAGPISRVLERRRP